PWGGWEKVQDVGLWNKYLPVWLKKNGYNTYYSGKLYNGHNSTNYDREGKYAAGWTESDFLIEPDVYSYYNSIFQHNKGDQHNKPEKVIGYSTDLITNYNLGYIDHAIKDNKPFFVVAAPIAPHVAITHPRTGHAIPEKKYNDKFPGLQTSGVLHIKDLGQITNPNYLKYLDTFYQKRIEALQSVDDMIAQVVKKLEAEGVLDTTYIIYSSDNDYHIGQHCMAPGKKCAFEEDINVPTVIRGPGVAKEIHAIQTYKTLGIQGSGYDLMYSVWCNQSAHELYDMTKDEYQMNNLHPGVLNAPASDNSQKILGRPLPQLLNRLDAVLMVQKSCKEVECRKPWDQLHPGGQVENLKDALNKEYDTQYANYSKVQFDKCFRNPVYHPWAEGPQWNGTQGQGQANLLMRNGLDWDSWA
ncbi:alkaline phosphatase-like protein, partial [Glonium stellatum]